MSSTLAMVEVGYNEWTDGMFCFRQVEPQVFVRDRLSLSATRWSSLARLVMMSAPIDECWLHTLHKAKGSGTRQAETDSPAVGGRG